MENPIYLLSPEECLDGSHSNALLGRIVANYAMPTADYQPPTSIQFDKGAINDHIVTNFQISVCHKRQRGGRFNLDSLLGFSVERKREYPVTVVGKTMLYRSLEQHETLLERMLEYQSVAKKAKQWAKNTLLHRRPPLCMIIGVLLCTETSITRNEMRGVTYSADTEVPVGTIALAAAGVVLPLQIGTVGIGGHATSENRRDAHYEIRGSTVVGLKLRVITCSKWKNDLRLEIGGPSLDKTSHLGAEDSDSDLDDLGQEEDTALDVVAGGDLFTIE